MKIFISADLEGVSGVVHTRQILEGNSEYERAKKLMTSEVNAAIEGAVESGAVEIVVNDSHNSMRNIIIEDMNPAARLISGFPKALLMMEGIDTSFDGAVFIGYHSMSSSLGILAHQISGSAFSSIKINGRLVGETALNAAVAGHFGVPVLAVSGDDMLEKEVSEILPDVEYARVKTVRGARAGECIVPVKAQDLIRCVVRKATANISRYKPLVIKGSLTVEVVLNSNLIADIVEIIPGVSRVSHHTVTFESEDIIAAMNMLFVMMASSCILNMDAYK